MARQMKDSGIEWIGEIPACWELRPARYAFSEVKEKNTDGTETRALQFKFGKIIAKTNFNAEDDNYVADTITNYTIVEPGTVMINGLNLNYDFKTQRVALVTERGVITSAYLALRPDERLIDAEYATYLFKGYESKMALHNMGAGIRLTLGYREFKNQPVLFPALCEQQRIVSFLDRKCAENDAVIERTKAIIEEYKKLKQAVITEAVTKGVRSSRPMKDSGIEWIGEIPEEWSIRKLFRAIDAIGDIDHYMPESVETGIPYLMTGDLRENVSKVRFELCKQVSCEDYMALSAKIKANQGDVIFARYATIGTVCYVDVDKEFLVSYSCLTIKPTHNLLLGKFLFYYLKSTSFYEDVRQYINSNTQANVGLDSMTKAKIVLPSVCEQEEIIHYLDEKCAALDNLIAKKTALLTELETYKKSIIYEYVTGKKECPEAVVQVAAVEYPFFPAAVNTKKLRFAQAMMMAKILDVHGKGIGRVKLEKMLYIIETSIGFDFDTEYVREAAGPLHESIYKCEGIISRQNHWYQLHQSQYGVSYIPTKESGKYRAYYDKYFSAYNAEIERIISIFKPYNTDQAEVIATLFAAWNDAIIDGKTFTDEDIVDDVLNNWHDNKQRFPRDMWLRAMDEMRENNLIPNGYGKKTVRRTAE